MIVKDQIIKGVFMKKLLQIILCAILALPLYACAQDTLDLSLLQIQYTQVMAIHISGGDIGEGDYLNSGKIEKFVTNMNVIKTLIPVEESEVDKTDIALNVYHNIGRLYVAVDDRRLLAVKINKGL